MSFPALASVRPALRLGRPLRLALVGLVAAAGLAPLGWWWLALPAFAALIWMLSQEDRARRAAFLGWCAGCGYFAAAMFWIVDPFMVDAAHDAWMAPFALIFLAAGMALFWGLAAGIAVPLGGGRPGRAMAFALTLSAAGLLRTYLLTGFPWALVGHVWIGAWPAQVAALGGPVLLSLMTLAAAAAPTVLGPVRGGLFAFALLGAAGGWGLWRLDRPVPPRTHPVVVRLIQPNAAQDAKWEADKEAMFFRRLLRLTAAPPAAGTPRPNLVAWPETSVPFLLNDPQDGLAMIAQAAQGSTAAIGIQRAEGRHYFNSMAILDPQGQVVGLYDKHHLVPFGEYVPLGNLIYRLTGIYIFASSMGYGYTPGPGPQTLDLGPLGRMLPLICYEGIFPQDLRAPGPRASWMLQITNDAWFGTLSGPYQHLAQTRLRAIEQGLPMMRAANTGVSAVIDAKGRVLKSLPMLKEGFIDAALPPALPATPYSRWGDWPAFWLLLALTAAMLATRLRRR